MSESASSPDAPEPRSPETASLASLRRHPWLTALGLLGLAIVVLVLLWDWNWFKGPIERRVEARTGREFEIGGDLDVDLGRITTIRADALRFGNAEWAKDPTMAATDRLEFGVELLPLLFKRNLRIPDIHLSKPRLRLEKGPKGVGNWVFGEEGELPEFRRLWIDDGQLRFLDAAAKTDIDVSVDSAAQGRDDAAPPIDVAGGGRWQGNKFTVTGRAESPLDLRDKARPYRVDARAQAGATKAHARGTLLDPLRLRDFDLQLALSGQDMADLFPLIGIATPPTPPYKLDGHFTRDRNTWHYDDFKGTVGDSDLAGDASVETGRARPYLRANLLSRRLDFDDLAGFIGAAPTARGEKTNPELAAQAARQAARSRVLPDTPYKLDRLRAMDADVRWKATRINSPKLPLDDMDAHLKLENAVLRLDPLNFGVAGGDIRSNIRMDAREKTIRTRADITARGMNLSKLLPTVEWARGAIGKVGGKVGINGSGNSIAKMLGSADGDIAISMGQGQVSKLLMRKAGLDIAGIVKIKLTQDSQIPVRCGFGDFSVKNGVMTARSFTFDTSDIILLGSGDVSLRDETIHLTIQPRPKRLRLLSLRSPLYAAGTFKDPTLRPDYKRVGLRAAAAVALGTIFPPAAALAAMTSPGGGKDSNCGGRSGK